MCEPWLFQGEYLCLLEPLPEHMLQEHNGTDSCCGTKRVGDEGVSENGAEVMARVDVSLWELILRLA